MFTSLIVIVEHRLLRSLAGLPAARAAGGRARHARTDADGGSVFLTSATMEMVYWILDPIDRRPRRAAHHAQHGDAVLAAAGAGRGRGDRLRLVRARVACWRVIATFCDIVDGLMARKHRRLVGAPARSSTPPSTATARCSSSAGSSTTTATHDQVLFIVLAATVGVVHGQLRDGQGRGDGRRRRRAAPCAAASARSISSRAAGMTAITKVIFADTPVLSMREAPMILAIAIVAGVANMSAVQRLGAIIQILRARQPPPPAGDADGDRRHRHQARDAHPRRRLTACSRRTRKPRCGPRCPARRARAPRARGRPRRARPAGLRRDGRHRRRQGAGQRGHRRRRQHLPRLHRRHQRQRARPLAPDVRRGGAGAGRGGLGRLVHLARARRAGRAARRRSRPRPACTGCSSTRAAPRRSRARCGSRSATPASTRWSASGAASTARRWARCR